MQSIDTFYLLVVVGTAIWEKLKNINSLLVMLFKFYHYKNMCLLFYLYIINISYGRHGDHMKY